MKFIAVILSIYVIFLVTTPCADAHPTDTNSVSIELLGQNHSHSDNIDSCSPFCFCTCCQTHFQPAFYNSMHLDLVCFDLIIPYIEQNYSNPTISFWHPPKN